MARLTVRSCWLLAMLASVAALLTIGYCWDGVRRLNPTNFTEVRSLADVERIHAAMQARPDCAGPDCLIKVPTGFFIQSMVFTSTSSVNINDFVWRKYPPNCPYKKGI